MESFQCEELSWFFGACLSSCLLKQIAFSFTLLGQSGIPVSFIGLENWIHSNHSSFGSIQFTLRERAEKKSFKFSWAKHEQIHLFFLNGTKKQELFLLCSLESEHLEYFHFTTNYSEGNSGPCLSYSRRRKPKRESGQKRAIENQNIFLGERSQGKGNRIELNALIHLKIKSFERFLV